MDWRRAGQHWRVPSSMGQVARCGLQGKAQRASAPDPLPLGRPGRKGTRVVDSGLMSAKPSPRIAYQGVPGAVSELAAKQFAPDANAVGFKAVSDAVKAGT